ncbi:MULTISPECIES: hypothetical protein [unclassified Cryobacterium]|uniref:phage tail tube protein n=1 Tax=unclassified Cryobacterium TaxID=2649013 RepID=UPI00106CE17D|nr:MULTISPECIES: hypothetical protein [unclassified Cryobacterium]TFB96525.1 hypothetical protein E3O39_10660 [Cryobacterium sp. MDB2-A-1]TFC12810.1 hypothetical protein E3O35_07825 [Cryobacterium sp. MDB2-A-2]
MAPANNASQVRVPGSGRIWKAPLGTAIPADSTTAPGAGFVELGFCTDGFVAKQDYKTKDVTVWQALEPVRTIPTALVRSFTFELQQTNKDTLGLAWGGAAITANATSIGTATIAITTGVVTSSVAHGLNVGDPFQFQGLTGATPFVVGTTYYVLTAPTGTTLTLAATVGGALIAPTIAGTATGFVKVTGSYSLAIPDAASVANFMLIIDWSDSVISQRIIIQRAALTSLPTVKFSRQDSISYAMEVQALASIDGTKSVLVYGVDQAVGY